jgi:hypothetical protein
LCQREALLLLKLKILLSLLLLLLKRLLRLEILNIGEPKLRRQIEFGLDLREASDRLPLRYCASFILGMFGLGRVKRYISGIVLTYLAAL